MRTLNDYFLSAELVNISASDQTWVPIPDDGHVHACYATLDGTITGTAVITFEIGGVAIGESLSVVAGDAGDTVSLEDLPATLLNRVTRGGQLEVITNGGSTNAIRVFLTIVIRR